MALITLPSKVHFEKVDKFQLLRSGTSLRSKYTGKRQAIVHPFALWVFEGRLVPMEGLDAGEWRAFLASLEGQKNTFQLPVPGASKPSAPGGGDVAAGPMAARSKSLNIVAAGAGIGYTINKGDYFTVNGELKIATAPCTPISTTVPVVLTFEPGLRNAIPADGRPLELRDPYCVMSATADDVATWSLERPVRHGIKLSAMEAF